MKRREIRVIPLSTIKQTEHLPLPNTVEMKQVFTEIVDQWEQIKTVVNSEIVQGECLECADKECQIGIFFDLVKPQKIFTCNRYINDTRHNDIKIQTEITENTRV